MFDSLSYDLLQQALTTLLVVGVPVVLVLSLAGAVAAALQAATGMNDVTLLYAVRLIALVAVLYLLAPGMLRSVVNLAEMAFKP